MGLSLRKVSVISEISPKPKNMKYIIFTFFISLANWGVSQITVTQADMPVGGYVAYLSIADTLFQPDLQTVGANVSWDFSGMNAVAQTRDSFVNVSSTPLFIRLFFSGSTVARVQETPDSLGGIALSEAFQYFRASSSAYENKGLGATIQSIPIGLNNNPADVIYRFPLDFGNTDSSQALAQLNIPGLFYIERSIKRWNEVDAWGTITTPYGSFNALRVKSIIQESDSVAADTIQFRVNVPQRGEYKWIAKEERVPVLTVNTLFVANNEISAGIQYVDSLRNTGRTTSISQPLDEFANLYPNPSLDQVNIQLLEKLGDQASIEVYGMDGKKVLDRKISGNLMSLSLGHLPKGVYQVLVRTEKRNYRGSLLLK